MAVTVQSRIATMGGHLLKLSHQSTSTSTEMTFNLFLPSSAAPSAPAPLLVYLSGLTCSPQNCSEKGFLNHHAARHSLAVLYPDTSPRGLAAADYPGLAESYDFGEAAGFYVDAEREPWSRSFRMETYVTRELPDVVFSEFGDRLDRERVSISGHSMGGHGALTLYLRNPGMYKSVSAWAPIANPTRCPWGEKAFAGYLGDDREAWKKHDATELVGGWEGPLNCLIDVGTGDNFYKQKQLLPENFEAAVKEAGLTGCTVRYHEEYDHSYYFISTFGADHVAHAAQYLKG